MSTLELLIDQINHGVITIDANSLRVRVINRRAREWLASITELEPMNAEVSALFTEVKLSRLLSKLKRGRAANFITEVSFNGRELPVLWSLSELEEGDVLIEGHDYSATRETELMLQSYSGMIERKNEQLGRERQRAERLLLNILPEKSISQLRQFGKTFPERFASVSVLFLDFVGFTQLSQQMSTSELFSELNEIFTEFDTIIKRHRCERIKTIGDAYLAVCGMPEKVDRHAGLITCAAQQMRAYIKRRNKRSEYTWRCRIGIHTGEVTGGVVGKLKYIYDIFGDGVNTASRMESYSEPMQINLSAATRALLSPNYILKSRGMIDVKGKGQMEMFFLDEILDDPCADQICEEEIFSPQDTGS